ncbi:MAG: bacillithiol biosynthesis BshC [Planctomycetes bacterium]|nr:bacillithiol biosynthesis BshC [Planctomycetota bacterium]
MTTLRFEDVAPGGALFHALHRGRVAAPDVPSIEEATLAAAARDLPRAALADAVVAGMRRLGAPQVGIDAAERLRERGTVAVVAGQQPVLFGGPHLVVAKALAAVATARRLTAGGTPAVPVFWVAAEDHDHAEVDHVHVPGADGAVERISVTLPGDRRMLSGVPMPDDTLGALARLAELLPRGSGFDLAMSVARPDAGDTVGDAFARGLLRLLGRFGLVVVQPDTLRPFAREVTRHELQHPGDLAAAIATASALLLAAVSGPPPLLLRRPELIFAVRDGVRHQITRISGGFEIDGHAYPVDVLLERLAADPAAFSWNVAARVAAQSLALPVAAQICGPSEMAYCAVLGTMHRRLGAPMPALVARPGLTFVEARVAAHCEALGARPEDVIRDPRCVAAPPPVADPAEIAEIRRLAALLPEGSGPAVRRRRAGVERELDLYADALRRESADRAATCDTRRTKVLGALRPLDGLQERSISILPFVARHGEAMLDDVLEAVGRPGAEHEVISLVGA